MQHRPAEATGGRHDLHPTICPPIPSPPGRIPSSRGKQEELGKKVPPMKGATCLPLPPFQVAGGITLAALGFLSRQAPPLPGFPGPRGGFPRTREPPLPSRGPPGVPLPPVGFPPPRRFSLFPGPKRFYPFSFQGLRSLETHPEIGGKRSDFMLRKRREREIPTPLRAHRVPSQILDLFQECCLKEEKAVLLWPEYMALSKAVFGKMEGDTFSFKNPSPLRESLMDPTITVSVTFSHLCRVYAFVTWFDHLVQEQTEEGKETHLFMRIPARVAVADSRSSCRVPVCPEALLETKVITKAGKTFQAKAVDICLTGILLQFEGEPPRLEKKEEVKVEIGLSEKKRVPLPRQEEEKEGEPEEEESAGEPGGEQEGGPEKEGAEKGKDEPEPERFREEILPVEKPFRIGGILIRKEGKKLGFYFPSCLTPEGLNPPDTLKRVVKHLEMAYLRKRAESASDEG